MELLLNLFKKLSFKFSTFKFFTLKYLALEYIFNFITPILPLTTFSVSKNPSRFSFSFLSRFLVPHSAPP